MKGVISAALLAGSVVASEWELVQQSKAALIVGVGAAFGDSAVGAASDNNVGGEAEFYQGALWQKATTGTGMNLDAAIDTNGMAVASTVWPIVVSHGDTFTMVTSLHGTSQSATTLGDGSFALVGTWVYPDTKESIIGVAVTTDGGETWDVKDTNQEIYARYGAFPTDTTWYVTTGIWGSDPQVPGPHQNKFQLSSRITVENNMVSFKNATSTKRNKESEVTGWYGSVLKSTDAGSTWTTVYESDIFTDYWYFNGIACSNENHCVAVAEGDNADGSYGIWAFTTFDGGVTWENTLQDNQLGLMQAAWINDDEGWLAGTGFGEGRGDLVGNFYKTTDGGATWTLEQALDNCFALDMAFAEGVGFAACSSSSGSSCSIAMYK